MKTVPFLVTVLMIVLGIGDAILVAFFGVRGSISQAMRDMGFTSPFFILVIGYLLGHFWGRMDTRPQDLTERGDK